MHVLSYLVLSVAKILHLLLNLYTLIVAFAVLLSWVRPDPGSPIVRFLHQLTEPVLGRIRRYLIPKALFKTGIDFSPMVLLFILIILDTVGVNLLYDLSATLLSK